MLCLITLLIVVSVIGFSDRLKSVFKPSDKLLPIYRVYTPEKKLAISFDAAWGGSDKTPIILNLLKKYDVKTTFFLSRILGRRLP